MRNGLSEGFCCVLLLCFTVWTASAKRRAEQACRRKIFATGQLSVAPTPLECVLALTLLVARILTANYHNLAVTADYLAFVAHGFYRRSYFHDNSFEYGIRDCFVRLRGNLTFFCRACALRLCCLSQCLPFLRFATLFGRCYIGTARSRSKSSAFAAVPRGLLTTCYGMLLCLS